MALARALIARARLLLDAPFSALGAHLRSSLRKEFSQRIADAGIAAVRVTHDELDARTMAARAVELKAGQLAALWAARTSQAPPDAPDYSAKARGARRPCTVAAPAMHRFGPCSAPQCWHGSRTTR
ncbi:hypothetical protein [Polaromonas sp.]|uniref:hypothetical protein n=1 Tax=Polaromonas sp. TaxID=1869339 RepID=UPI00286B2249|nr:hypothetical protein [Polaromonas sp.]